MMKLNMPVGRAAPRSFLDREIAGIVKLDTVLPTVYDRCDISSKSVVFSGAQ